MGRFLERVGRDGVLVGEDRGVYGDSVLKWWMDRNVKIGFVGGYVMDRYRGRGEGGKRDVVDCGVVRDFGERYGDKVK